MVAVNDSITLLKIISERLQYVIQKYWGNESWKKQQQLLSNSVDDKLIR